MKSKISVDTTSIVFPCGAGGNFLASLLFDQKFVRYNEKFNEYKLDYTNYSSPTSGACYWFHLDETISEDGSAEHSDLELNAVDKLASRYHIGLGHHLPFMTDKVYNFDCNNLIEVTSENEVSAFMINLAGLIKNDIYTDFSSKHYQIADIVNSLLNLAISKKMTIEDVYTRTSTVNLSVHTLQLNADARNANLSDRLVYTPNTVAIWKFICSSVLNDIRISLDSYNEYILNSVKYWPDDRFSPISQFNLQTTARSHLKEKLDSGMDSIEYCDLFYDLRVPSNFARFIRPEYQSNYKEIIAIYSIRNLKISKDVVYTITSDLQYHDIIKSLQARLIFACDANNLHHLIPQIQAI